MRHRLHENGPSADHPTLPVLIGPTAVGKTELSLLLAEKWEAEIVSVDSRQVYRHLDIGTAKPTQTERQRVPHHFIDELELDEPSSAGRFAEAAWIRMAEILTRGRKPLVVGGSTLYLQALLEGIANIPPVDNEIRPTLMHRLDTEGSDALYQELLRIDPQGASRLDATKSQRLVRALEVYYGTGRPWSSFWTEIKPPPYRFSVSVLTRDRTRLYDRIERRVDAMLEQGLVGEVEELLSRGYSPDLNLLRTIGYREPIQYLHGEIDYAEMVRLIKRNTRRYAKRQLTWFRRNSTHRWIDLDLVVSPTEAVHEIRSV